MPDTTRINDSPPQTSGRKNGGLHSIPGGAKSEQDKQRAHEIEMRKLDHELGEKSDRSNFDRFTTALKALLPVLNSVGSFVKDEWSASNQREHELTMLRENHRHEMGLAEVQQQTEIYRLLAGKK